MSITCFLFGVTEKCCPLCIVPFPYTFLSSSSSYSSSIHSSPFLDTHLSLSLTINFFSSAHPLSPFPHTMLICPLLVFLLPPPPFFIYRLCTASLWDTEQINAYRLAHWKPLVMGFYKASHYCV